jgi:hypothetical protein
MRFLYNLQKIDRRIMYLLLAVVVIIPLTWDVIRMPLTVMPEVKGVYDTIENLPTDGSKVVIVSIWWNAGTKAENQTQVEVIARHLFMRGVPFMLMPWDQQGTKIADKAVADIAAELHKQYGKDWINIGYRPGYLDQILPALAQNPWKTLGNDQNGTPMSKIPMMQKVKSVDNFGLVVETTPAGTLPAWISRFNQPFKIPLAYAPTAVMVPEGYNYVDSHQVVGMLPGLVGAAQYDELLHHRGFAARGANALSFAHALIIVLIILGNLGYFLSRRQASPV